MEWLLIIIALTVLLAIGMIVTIIIWLHRWLRKSPDQTNQAFNSPIQDRQSSKLTAGDLADLVLLRLELQSLFDREFIDSEQQANLNQKIDALCTQHLADFAAVPDNALWQKRRTIAWDLLNQYSDTPLGLPPWRTASPAHFEPVVTTQAEPVKSDIPITPPPLASDLIQVQTASFSIDIETEPEISISLTDPTKDAINRVSTPDKQTASFAIDEEDHPSVLPYQPASPKTNNPDSTLNQYAWKAHEPTRLERALTTLSGWHSMAVPFLVQNIGWFIGVFCFIAGSIFLVHSTQGYASNLIAFFAFLIFTLALLFGGYQLRRQRPELETSSTVIFILSLLLIPLTNITGTQLLISSESLGLQLLSGVLVLAELGVFYFAVTLVSGLMDRSLQQGLPRFFLALTAMSVLQVLLTDSWWLLAVIHLLIFVLLSVGVYLFATQWLQSIFVDQHKIGYFAAGMLIYAAVTSFVFITVGNNIALPYGYYGFFLMLLCGLLFFIDAQLKQWIDRYASLSRFSFLVYGLSVLALCLVAQYPIARLFTLVLAIGLYAFIVWSYLTLTPLTILLVCYFWLYSSLVLPLLPTPAAPWYLLASLPVLFSLYYAANWALNKRQSAYLAVIIYRVLYGLLAVLTIWSLACSESGLLAMTTATIASVLIYYTLKAAPIVIFTPYSKIADSRDAINRVSTKENLLTSRWFYTIPLLAAMTVYYTPRLFLSEFGAAQFSVGLVLLAGFWTYQGLAAFFKAHSSSGSTQIEQRLNSALLSLLIALLPVLDMPDPARIIALFSVGTVLLWLSVRLLMRGLFYLLLAVWGAAFALLKLTYFPYPSNGLVTVLLGIIIWCWLWFIKRREQVDLMKLWREQRAQTMALLPACRLIGLTKIPSERTVFRDVIDTPLEQLMCLSWLLTMKALVMYAMSVPLSPAWMVATCLTALFSVLLIVRYQLVKLLPVPIVLALWALLALLDFQGLQAESLLLAACLYALTVWRLLIYSCVGWAEVRSPSIATDGLRTSAHPIMLLDDSETMQRVTHHTAFFIVLISVGLQLFATDEGHNLTVLLTLLTTAGFLWLSDRTYPHLVVRYLVLGFSLLAVIPWSWQTLSTNSYSGFLFVALATNVLSIPTNSYSRPAAITAIWLVIAGVFLQITQLLQTTPVITELDCMVLFLAGGSLLLANAKLKWALCSFSAFMMWVLAVLWLEHSVFHAGLPFSLWLGRETFTDTWLLLALLSFVMTLLSEEEDCIRPFTQANTLAINVGLPKNGNPSYATPLNTAVTLCFVWSLLGTLTLFFDSAGQADLLVELLLVLLLTIFPLSKDRSGGAQLRGFFSACLPALAVFCLLPTNLDDFALQTASVVFGYTLWLVATVALPYFNKCYSPWTIEPLFFPWLGLLLVAFSGTGWLTFTADDIGIYCLELFVYCLLMLRYSNWAVFSWSSAFAFIASGIAFSYGGDHSDESSLISLLLWTNLQLLLVTFWQRKGEKLAQRWQWQQAPSALAFEYVTWLVFIGYLLIATILLGLDPRQSVDVLPVYIVLNLSLLHLLWIRFSVAPLHGFIYNLFLSLLAVYSHYFNWWSPPALLLALWSTALFSSVYVISRFSCRYQREIIRALRFWLTTSLCFATLVLLINPGYMLGEWLLSLAIVTCLSAALGWQSTRSAWSVAASIELLLLLHSWPFLLVDADVYTLLPWYALQMALFASLFSCLLTWLSSNADDREHNERYTDGAIYVSGLIALSLLELCGHGILFAQAIMTGASPQWITPPLDAIAALSTGVIISLIGMRHVRHLPDSKWVYGIVMLAGALAFYGRLLWLGAEQVSLWDTAALIAFAYSLFFLQRLFPSRPLLNSALLMPVLALLTAPLQLASPETSLTLIATGLLYVMMRRHTKQKIPLYLALLAFNAGVYLWVPALVDSSQLIQIYVIPAALTTLMLLHLHSRELKPSVLMGGRLAAISSIYACATADVFLRDQQSVLVFILAMGLSVAGILIGIALRTRAFLYAGVSFLLLNVIGQLIRFYPEQGLGKAIVLMVMGMGIISLMIWFNIKRVAILQRISAFQTEMQSWE